MLMYLAWIVRAIVRDRMLRIGTCAEEDHCYDNAKRFLAYMGIVESYNAVGGEDNGAPFLHAKDKSRCIVDTVLSAWDPADHINGENWSLRHVVACFFRARAAARLIQRRWRKYKRVVRQNAVRALHMIKKYAHHLPAEIVYDIAFRAAHS